MATTQEYIEYVMQQIQGLGLTRYRKMFGEYMVYVDDKPILLVCDNIVYVKKLEVLDQHLKDADCGIPYRGAKEHYILDVDDRNLVENVAEVLIQVIPVPKPRKKKN